MNLKLRPYQREAIDNLRSRWGAGAIRVPLVLATGLGKTVIFSTLISEWLDENPGKRALVIAHTNELIEQAAKSIRQISPGRRVGIVKGSLNNVTAEIIVSSRQTLARENRRAQIQRVGLVIIDECHFAVRANSYGTILEHFGAFEETSPVKVAGFTATLARSDKQKLSSIWEDCTFKRDILFGIRNGYLSDVKGERIVVDGLDARNFKTVGGDFSEQSVGEELERTFAVETVAKEWERLARDRKTIAFWPLVSIAEAAAAAFNALGVPSAVISGQTDKAERRRILADFKSGKIWTLHNAMLLTAGFDEPSIDCVVNGRFTKSPVLYCQMGGRGTRINLLIPPEQRRPLLLLDVTGASETLGLQCHIDLSPERPLGQQAELHPDATLSELEEFYAEQIEEELGGQRSGATSFFESEEYRGATTTKAFDPLGRDKVWGRTAGGTYFVKASVHGKADAFVFVVESLQGEPGTYDIVQCSTNLGFNPRYDAAPEWAGGTEHVGLHLDMALAWGEELAGEAYSTRKSSWRRREPSAGQQALARMRGVPWDGVMSAGELSEAIDQAVADRRIDPLVARVRSSVQ